MVDKLTDYIIRPTRRRYNAAAEMGPTLFTIDYIYYGSRIDFEVKNRRNKVLKCSLFHHNIYNNERYPLMVYCHGNSGNRTYSYEIVYKILRHRISVLTFDFAGCGNSEGKYVFLGLFEQFDIEDVLAYALDHYSFIDPKKIGIWGRSMGAVATLMFASRNHYISLIVLDSPFKDLAQLLREYINRFKIVSSLMGNYLYTKIRKRALEKANFDFEELKPINCISTCRAPAYFIHATKDKIVPIHHSKELYEAYPADKEYCEIKGGHNSKRPPEAYLSAVEFIKGVFDGTKKDTQGERQSIKQKKDKAYYYEVNTEIVDTVVEEKEKGETSPERVQAPKDDDFDFVSRCGSPRASQPDIRILTAPDDKQDGLCRERVDMKELNHEFMSSKDQDDYGVSMISMDETTFRLE